jgi:hypothetical protein
MENVKDTEEIQKETSEEVVIDQNTEEIQETESKETEIPKEEVKEPKGVVNKFGKLTQRNYELQNVIKDLSEKLKKYDSESLPPQVPIPQEFDEGYGVDQKKYQTAMSDYWKKIKEWDKGKEESAKIEEQVQQRYNERLSIYREQIETLKTEEPDILNLVSNVKVTPVVEAAILESEESGKIAVYLGKNPAEAAKLNQMEPYQVGEYLGRIEEKLSFTEKKQSKAAPPIIPLDGKTGTIGKKPSEMTDQEWQDSRRKEKLIKLKKG